MRLVYSLWSYDLDDLTRRVQAVLDQHPNARLVALSHSATPIQAKGDLRLFAGRGFFWQPEYIGRLQGQFALSLLYTAMLVLEEPAAAERYPRPPGQLPGPPS